MGRWEPNASGRLGEAALELYLERGFEQTTVADIAQRAGLTARTFFRYYADKREVLFAGAEVLQRDMVAAVEGAPAEATPLEAVALGLDAAGALIGERRDFSRRRQAVIAANDDLRERELIKMATLSEALAGSLRRRGVPEAAAALAGETGIAVFRVAFERWITGPEDAELVQVMRDSLDQLRALAA